MQHALPHVPTQRVTAIAAALSIGAGLGAVAIANSADDDVAGPSAPAVSVQHEPTGGDFPTPAGGARHRVAPATAGDAPQSFGGQRP